MAQILGEHVEYCTESGLLQHSGFSNEATM